MNDYEKVRAALLDALYKVCTDYCGYYDFQCPACDKEEEGAECECKTAFDAIGKLNSEMRTVVGALKEHDGQNGS